MQFNIYLCHCSVCPLPPQVTLSHGKPRFTFPLPSGIRQSSPVTMVDKDGNICFQVTEVFLHCFSAVLHVYDHLSGHHQQICS